MTPSEQTELNDHSPKINSPILVTGAHRTGTTWVGKMLAANSQTAYISEPLNVLHRPGVFNTPTRYWYTYISKENQDEYLPGLLQTFCFRYHFMAEIASLRSLKDLARMGRDVHIFLAGRLRRLRPLVKDPFAVFSTLWFAEQLGCQVVITVRHPAAFVSSLKRLVWPFDLADLLNQPLLMRDKLEPFRSEIEHIRRDPTDTIGHNSLLWRLVYHVVRDFQEKHPQFLVVRHEDLSSQPVEGFKALYDKLGINFSSRTKRAIVASSNPENPKELASNAAHSIRLNSRLNLDNWKRRLTSKEVSQIRRLTEEVANFYYPEQDWG